MKLFSIWLLLALIAIFFAATLAQTDGKEPVEPVEPVDPADPADPADEDPPTTTTTFAKLSFTMKIPIDHDIINWQNALNKLSETCGVSNLTMLKDGPGEKKFKFYTPVSGDFAAFKTACEDKIENEKGDLSAYGSVSYGGMEEVQFPQSCTTTCGTTECPACPLLTECTEDAQCGPDARCAESKKDSDEKWCISSSAFVFTSTIAFVLAVATIFF